MCTHRMLLALVSLILLCPLPGEAAPITLSGTVTYNGPHDGDSIYVVVIDTLAGGDPGFVATQAFAAGDSPLSQPYAFNLETTIVPATVWIAALLDVDGGGMADKVGLADVVGWYASAPIPTEISTATSTNGLDFALPTGEIRGSVSFAPNQTEADLIVSEVSRCLTPSKLTRSITATGSGPYALIGVYAGSYCLSGFGYGMAEPLRVCYGDFSCATPIPIVVGEGEIVNGIHLSFIDPAPARVITWGTLKARYP